MSLPNEPPKVTPEEAEAINARRDEVLKATTLHRVEAALLGEMHVISLEKPRVNGLYFTVCGRWVPDKFVHAPTTCPDCEVRYHPEGKGE